MKPETVNRISTVFEKFPQRFLREAIDLLLFYEFNIFMGYKYKNFKSSFITITHYDSDLYLESF